MAQEKNNKLARMICIAIIAVCLVGLAAIGATYLKAQLEYSNLQGLVQEQDAPAELDKDSAKLKGMTVDWDALSEKNDEVVAWVRTPKTKIDYPVTQASDNEKYLHQSFEGASSPSGTIFLDCRDSSDFTGLNSFLYGHHMRDGSMFAQLSKMNTQESFDANRTVYLLTPQRNMKLRTIALVDAPFDDSQIQTRPASQQEMTKYVKQVMKRAVIVADDIDSTSVTQTVCLVTCDELGSNGRYILVCSIEKSVDNG